MDAGNSCSNFPSGFAGNGNPFDAYWQGEFLASTAGNYVFGTNSDDGSGIYIDGTLVDNNFNNQSATLNSGSIYLSPGLHDIVVAYYQNGGQLAFNAQYQPPGAGSLSIMPNSVLLTATTPVRLRRASRDHGRDDQLRAQRCI